MKNFSKNEDPLYNLFSSIIVSLMEEPKSLSKSLSIYKTFTSLKPKPLSKIPLKKKKKRRRLSKTAMIPFFNLKLGKSLKIPEWKLGDGLNRCKGGGKKGGLTRDKLVKGGALAR